MREKFDAKEQHSTAGQASPSPGVSHPTAFFITEQLSFGGVSSPPHKPPRNQAPSMPLGRGQMDPERGAKPFQALGDGQCMFSASPRGLYH